MVNTGEWLWSVETFKGEKKSSHTLCMNLLKYATKNFFGPRDWLINWLIDTEPFPFINQDNSHQIRNIEYDKFFQFDSIATNSS